jgi:hypothetical protein
VSDRLPTWSITVLETPRGKPLASFVEALHTRFPETRALLGPNGLGLMKGGEWPTHVEDIVVVVKELGPYTHVTLHHFANTGSYRDDWEKDFLSDFEDNGKVEVSHYKLSLERYEIPSNKKLL